MADLKSPALLWAKGFLFLFLGLFAAVLLVVQAPSFMVAALLVLSIWAFCRAYYFAFYVIEHYVDSTYRFSGLISFVQYAMGGGSAGRSVKAKKEWGRLPACPNATLFWASPR